MVIFNDLRITEDKDCLIVDCYIEDIDGYDGMYIDTVDVDYYKNVTDDGTPSDKAINLYTKSDDENGLRSIRVSLPASRLNKDSFGTDTFDKGLFFVIVNCDGTPLHPDILESYSCGADNMVDVGVVVDWQSIYALGINYASKLAYGCSDKCEVPSGYEAFVLYWYALQLAISTCDWPLVRKLWDKFLRALVGYGPTSISGGSCGCKR